MRDYRCEKFRVLFPLFARQERLMTTQPTRFSITHAEETVAAISFKNAEKKRGGNVGSIHIIGLDQIKMESILVKLVQPDSAVIAEGSRELKALFQKSSGTGPEIWIPELCRIMTNCPEPAMRQYSALLLRKKFTKAKNWSGNGNGNGNGALLGPEARETVKQGCLQVRLLCLLNLM